MSEEMVGNHGHFLRGYGEGQKEGYLKALADIKREVNAIPTSYNTITIELFNGLISKLIGDERLDR